jgi:dihydroorotate dehydrogenase electron transfer subunit
VTGGAGGPVQVAGELLEVRAVGAHHHLTLAAPGVPERFRPGAFVAVGVGGPLSSVVLRRALPVHRVRAGGAHGGTLECVLTVRDPIDTWLTTAAPGTPLDVLGPLGRPFALPKEPVPCVLVGHGVAGAVLFPVAERLRERGCPVHLLLGADTEAGLVGALEARRSARSVTVATGDGSVGSRGTVLDVLPDLLARTAAAVVYAAGPPAVLHGVARAAEAHGAWSQTALDVHDLAGPGVCGTGLCLGCVLPVVGEDGVTRMVRACTEGPVLRGDRVRWDDLGTVPSDARGAS